jgi:hypothetical protein
MIDLAFACAFVIPGVSAHKYSSIYLAVASLGALVLRPGVEWYRVVERVGDDQ